ncbi:MAG: preprotein translocase subunit SecE [Bacteroidia bacterium]
MDKIKAIYKDYAEELLYKVQWPSLDDLQSSTITVLIASLIIALIIGFMDFGFKFITDLLYSIF